eukprot:CAMPEP_0174267382 /NCGR_PEP_ID=MMETSP0439-20130205/33446_1 /TAXON_ID=0 /ORGANISM="Stereomyxa ramosa, Strain Chinc5" /LENGTH=218 /DNA_ID=CAMNT_0015354843 /DNA_START=11 /DNA_END=667 /DNA_ORIENTATION=+
MIDKKEEHIELVKGTERPTLQEDELAKKIMGVLISEFHQRLNRDRFNAHCYERKSFYYISTDKGIFMCVVEKETSPKLCCSFLSELETHCPNVRPPLVMKELLGKYNNQNEISEIMEVIEETKSIMQGNIETLLERGDKLQHISQKAIETNDAAQRFQKSSKKLNNSYKYPLIGAAIGAALFGPLGAAAGAQGVAAITGLVGAGAVVGAYSGKKASQI